MKENLPFRFFVYGCCDECGYSRGQELDDNKGGHCGYNGSIGNGMCGANTIPEVKK